MTTSEFISQNINFWVKYYQKYVFGVFAMFTIVPLIFEHVHLFILGVDSNHMRQIIEIRFHMMYFLETKKLLIFIRLP